MATLAKKRVNPISSSRKLITLSPAVSIYQIYLQSLAPSGRAGIRCLLNFCASHLDSSKSAATYPWQQLDFAKTAKLRADLLDAGYAVATVNLALAALRGLARVAFNLGLIDADDLNRIYAVKRVKGESVRKGRSLKRMEVKALIAACRSGANVTRSARDEALLLVAVGAGLRAMELTSLKVDDLDLSTGVLHVKRGKGRKQRLIHLPVRVLRSIVRWLKISNKNNGVIFSRISRAGTCGSNPLSTQGVTCIFAELAATACVASFSPHDLRRTYITHLLESGVDLNTVRQLAGHSDISTTIRYDLRAAHNLASVAKSFSCW